ncbi:MAG: glycosyltransferase [Clostridia bacterium]|nr:glycosyltransferase [Clostridia bacterium]
MSEKQTDRERAPFSVAMSVYKNDNGEFVERALESITKAQTVKPDEIVLIVDGSVSEAVEEVIQKYEREYTGFQAVRLPENKGLGNALQLAVDRCSYPLIARMDSDDVALPTRFEQQLKCFAENESLDIVGGDITEFIGEESNIVGKRSVPKENGAIKAYMKKRCAFNHMSVMYKKEAVLQAGNYQDWFWNEDYYLWIRMQLKGCSFANTGTVLVNVRVGEEMYRRRGGWKYFKSERDLQKYMRKHKMIGFGTYCMNVAKRFIVQILLPNRLRGWIFRKFARSSNECGNTEE